VRKIDGRRLMQHLFRAGVTNVARVAVAIASAIYTYTVDEWTANCRLLTTALPRQLRSIE